MEISVKGIILWRLLTSEIGGGAMHGALRPPPASGGPSRVLCYRNCARRAWASQAPTARNVPCNSVRDADCKSAIICGTGCPAEHPPQRGVLCYRNCARRAWASQGPTARNVLCNSVRDADCKSAIICGTRCPAEHPPQRVI